MTTLKIYSFHDCGRSWADWLNRDVIQVDEISTPIYAEPRWYEESGRFLSLIHFEGLLKDGDISKANEIERQWESLSASVRNRVFWLIYSGGGFWQLTSGLQNIHYLRYEVSRKTINPDDRVCFLSLIKGLERSELLDLSLWEALYPSDNINAITLLAVLSLEGKNVDFHRIMATLLQDSEQLHKAHHEFAARVAIAKGPRPPALNDWLDSFRFGKYAAVRRQLSEVFSSAPD